MLSSQLLELFIQLVGLNKGGTMKKYLFGLGAMLVGAGLMFVFTHTEVSALGESKYDKLLGYDVPDADCQVFELPRNNGLADY